MKSAFLFNKWAIVPPEILARPAVIVGEAGSGKTETLLRLAYVAVKVYGYQVVFLDAKGDEETAARFLAAMWQAGKEQVSVFPFQPYNAWTGNADTLFNRLMAVQDFSEPYYKNITSLLLSLALGVPGGPPRSSHALLENLTLATLRVRYRGTPHEHEVERITEKDANGVYNRYRAFFSLFKDKLDHGFTFDTQDAAYVLLDMIAYREEAASVGRYLLEDLAHYVARRKPSEKKVLIIIDEVSALAIANIANLAERLRSYGGPMVLSSQSEQGLAKNQDERARILGTAHTVFLHTCSAPEPFIARAGMHKQVRAGWSVHDQTGTGYGTMQLQEEYLISPDEVRRLQTGEVYLIANGQGQKARIAPLHVEAEFKARALACLRHAEEERSNQTVQIKEEALPETEPLKEADNL
ncbi:MAG TPA: TraM recognition domain-containing protein [Ktedonobacteraceae bacterium]|nr:TraM recognition domain-containing protein [Ktedonobacteraceae bacterium]